MLKKILDVIRKNFIIIMLMIIFVLICVYIKHNYMDIIQKVDNSANTFFTTKMISESNTNFMKNITYFGDYILIGLIFITSLFIFRNKIIATILSIDLMFIGGVSLLLKKCFSRIRPNNPLIVLPNSYSFPSGHTMFAVGFYGLLIYFIWKSNINKLFKYILTFVFSMITIFVGISRIYLGVHYFTDVIGGFILGILTIILFINIYLKFDWKWKK